jgi:hypothetical protein
MAPIREMICASICHTAKVVKERAAMRYDDGYWWLEYHTEPLRVCVLP